MTNMHVPQGSTAAGVYAIEMCENDWLALDSTAEQALKDAWVEQAKLDPDAEHAVLRLTPDALFPINGHDKPYLAWKYNLNSPTARAFDTKNRVLYVLHGLATDERTRHQLEKAIAALPSGTTWKVVNRRNAVISSGVA